MAKRLIDLHGKTTAEVEPLVDDFLHKANVAGFDKVRIMTGKGSGKVKSAVTKYLKLGGYPWSLERNAKGTVNEGVLVIHLD